MSRSWRAVQLSRHRSTLVTGNHHARIVAFRIAARNRSVGRAVLAAHPSARFRPKSPKCVILHLRTQSAASKAADSCRTALVPWYGAASVRLPIVGICGRPVRLHINLPKHVERGSMLGCEQQSVVDAQWRRRRTGHREHGGMGSEEVQG